jgi:dihydroorotase
MGLNLGFLKIGEEANLTIIGTEPLKVDVEAFQSKGKNNPFDGWTLKGFPLLTICKGKIAYKRRNSL